MKKKLLILSILVSIGSVNAYWGEGYINSGLNFAKNQGKRVSNLPYLKAAAAKTESAYTYIKSRISSWPKTSISLTSLALLYTGWQLKYKKTAIALLTAGALYSGHKKGIFSALCNYIPKIKKNS